MTVALTHTVLQVVTLALSKVGVDAATTEPKNVEDAHRNLNLILAMWSADNDMAIQGLVPVNGFTELTDTVTLPPEYITALVFNLAIAFTPDTDQTVDKATASFATECVNTIKSNNIRRYTVRIPANGLLT